MNTNDESASNGAEWFAAWLPKSPAAAPALAQPGYEPEPQPLAVPQPLARSPFLEAVRSEIEAVSRHLTDPTTDGVTAAIPHLERAVAEFSSQLVSLPAVGASLPDRSEGIEAVRSELSRANRLFEQAYELHSTWATQLGIHLDGTPRQLLYDRSGHPAPEPVQESMLDSAMSDWKG